jgi:sugar O-acyltransferase (sialic acid O-acetyltransferase NeuD family)
MHDGGFAVVSEHVFGWYANPMIRVLIIGAGGQGLIVADILQRARAGGGDNEPTGLLDDNPELNGARVLGLPVLGTCARLSEVPHDAVVVAIGDNARRAQMSLFLEQRGERLVTACHPGASIASTAEIGAGSMISAGVVVVPNVRVGRGVLLNTQCSVDHDSVIDAFAHIGPGATLGASVSIGEGALVGLGASVMSGRRVGPHTIVGAGALVARDLPGDVIATGVPARITRSRR